MDNIIDNKHYDIHKYDFIKATSCDIKFPYFLNLKLISDKLDINDIITGIKYIDNNIYKGNINTNGIESVNLDQSGISKKKKKKKEKKEKKRRDFSNQCTIKIKTNTKTYTIKTFMTSLVFTGCKNIDDGKNAVKLLFNELNRIRISYKLIDTCKMSDILHNVSEFLNIVQTQKLLIYQLFLIFNLSQSNIDINYAAILNQDEINICDIDKLIDNQTLLTYKSMADLKSFIKILQIYKIFINYYPNRINTKPIKDYFSQKLRDPNSNLYKMVIKLYNGEQIDNIGVSIDADIIDKYDFRTNNYNTMFSINHRIDREKLIDILKTKYVNKHKILYDAIFKYGIYSGISVKYISKVECSCNDKSNNSNDKSDNTSDNKSDNKNDNCMCKLITISVFCSGKILINGCRTINQIQDGYNIISNILDKEHDNIYVKDSDIDTSDNSEILPSIIRNNKTYLNLDKVIYNNPRNFIKCKRGDLLHLFKND
jgi:TATA-box binding protein (TBP) (component of TFIID and TFIIIB)